MPALRASRAHARIGATFALAIAGIAFLPSGDARAQCLPAVPVDGDTVTCTGVIGEGFRIPAGINDVTVIVDPGATITTIGDGISANRISDITNHGSVTVNGQGSAALRVGQGIDTDRSTVTNSATGTIVLNADGIQGLVLGVPLPAGGQLPPPSLGDARNDGSIVANGDSTVAVFVGASNDNNNGANRSTATNGATGTISLVGDNSFGLAVERSVDVTNLGTISGSAFGGIGISARGDNQGRAATVDNSGTIMLDGDSAVGIFVGQTAQATNNGTITMSGANTFGINGGAGIDDARRTLIENAIAGTITISGSDGVGIFLNGFGQGRNLGTITASGPMAIGIQASQNDLVDNLGSIAVSGDGAVGVEIGQNSQATNDGSIVVSGDGAIGVSVGALSQGTNNATITTSGANAIGMEAQLGIDTVRRSLVENAIMGSLTVGDGGVGLSLNGYGQARNDGMLAVQGTTAIGIRSAQDDSIVNAGSLVVSGVDAIGISADDFDPTDGLQGSPNFANVINAIDPTVGGTASITSTNPDAGALIQLRNTGGAANLNRVRNAAGAEIRADLTNVATMGRGVAIEGSPGVDEIINAGTIDGKIELGDGDDAYIVEVGGVLMPIAGGVTALDGGPGNDEIRLGSASSDLGQFAVDFAVANVERLRVQGLWSLTAPVPVALPVTVDPGGSLLVTGATRIDGDLGFAAPSGGTRGLLRANVDNSSAALPQLVSVGGTATLTDGALEVFVDNQFSGSATVTVLRADTEMVGRFAAVSLSSDPAIALSALLYDDVANTASFTLTAMPFTPNQAAVDAYLKRVNASSPPANLQTVLDGINGQDFTGYRQSLFQLNPESYDAHTATTLELANRYTQLMIERPRYCLARRGERRIDPRTKLPCQTREFEPWIAAYGQLGNRTGQSDHIHYEDEGFGVVAGLDHRLTDQWLLTATIGGAYDSLNVLDVGRGRIKTLDLGLYAGYTRGPLRLQGVASYGHGWQNRFRNLRLPGFARTAEADWGTNRIGTRFEGEYVFDWRGIDLVPLASLDYTAFLQDGFTETGAQPVALAVDARTDHVVTVRAGFELTRPLHKTGYWTELLELADGVWRPTLSVRWRQVVSGADRPISARFVGDPSPTTGTFTITGDAPDRGFEVGAGLAWTPRRANRLTFGVRYDVFVWENVASHDLTAGVRFGF